MLAVFASMLTSGCAELNSIYRSQSLPGNKPHVVSIDAKQRVVLSNPGHATAKKALEELDHAKNDVDAKREAKETTQRMCDDTVTDTKTAKCKDSTEAKKALELAEKHYELLKGVVAKQGTENGNLDIVRFCAEPPPDVFTAIASSLGLEASFSQASAKDAAAKLASTISENAATIERTQTVNILREAMYRNCERYLSGAISEEEFIVQAARDQQLIVQVLAVEQITGVAKAQSTALTTVAKAAAGGISDASLQTLAEARKDAEAKRQAQESAEKTARDQKPAGPCGAADIDENTPPAGVTAADAKAKNAHCKTARETAKPAKEAEEHYALVKDTVAKQGAVSSEVRGQLATAAMTASAANKEIAEKVVEIARLYQAFDEIGMTCVVKLRTQQEPPKYCEALLQQMADTRAAQLLREEARLKSDPRVKELRKEMDEQNRSLAKIVWDKLRPTISGQALDSLRTKAKVIVLGQDDPRRQKVLNARSEADFATVFNELRDKDKDALAKAAESP
jgi:hypothetical protein